MTPEFAWATVDFTDLKDFLSQVFGFPRNKSLDDCAQDMQSEGVRSSRRLQENEVTRLRNDP